MRVKVWFSSHLLVLAVVAVSLLVSCGQEEPAPSATFAETPAALPTLKQESVPESTDESLISEKTNGDDDEPAVSEPANDAGSTISDDQQTAGARLATALRMLNPDLTDPQPRNIGFTDWSLVKEYMDLQN